MLAAALTLAGCAGQPAPDSVEGMRIDAATVATPESSRRSAYEYHVLAGEMAIQRGHRDVAAREYVAALDYSNDRELAERATQIALFAGEAELAYRAAGTWAAAEPDSLDAQRTAARLALATGDASGLAVYARSLVAAASSTRTGYQLLADLLSGENDRADLAIDTLTDIAQRHPESAPAQHAPSLSCDSSG